MFKFNLDSKNEEPVKTYTEKMKFDQNGNPWLAKSLVF